MREQFPLTIHATPSRKTVVAIMRGEVTIGTTNTKGVLGMLADISWSGNKSRLLMGVVPTTFIINSRQLPAHSFDCCLGFL